MSWGGIAPARIVGEVLCFMKKNMLLKFSVAIVGVMLAGATMVSATNITGTTTPSYTSPNGTIGFYNLTSFGTAATTQGGLIVQVNYTGGSNSAGATCTWTTGVNGCSVANGFSVSLADGANGSYDGTWTLTDSRTGGAIISSIVFIGSGAGNPAGLTGFDLCFNSPGTTPDYLNAGNCNGVGTVGSNIGWSAGTAAGGTTGLSPNSIVYTNAVALPSTSPVGDEFSKVTFGFCTVSNGSAPCNAAANTFQNGNSMTWRMDTDTLSTPEPATLGLVGFSLFGLGALKRRRRNRAKSSEAAL